MKSLIVNILFSSYFFTCCASNDNINDLNLEQQKNYITSSVNAFFEIRKTDSDVIKSNYIFSPFGLDTCIATIGHTLSPQSKQNFDDKLLSLGINNNMDLFSQDKSKLQFIISVLTQNGITMKAHKKLDLLNINVGEYLLQNTDYTDVNIRNLRNEYQQKITNLLNKKFQGKLNLDYKSLWSADNNPLVFLKVVSAIKFKDIWQDKPFKNIGLNTFHTRDNREVKAEFLKKTVDGVPIKDDNSNWQAIRLFYKQQYAIDIILPSENNQTTDTDKTKIIYSLINKLNHNAEYGKTRVTMPKFEYKQKNSLSDYITENVFDDVNLDFTGFLQQPANPTGIDAQQECYVKIDEEGTTAEALTDVACAISASIKQEFLINRSYYFVISEYKMNKENYLDPLKIKNIIMIGEVVDPTHQ